MTVTAVAAGEQFGEFYGLEIAVIPPNRPCVRADEPDRLFPTVEEKEHAVVGQVPAAHAPRRPGARGRAGLRCAVRNAKIAAEKPAFVAKAGAYGAITVSTQMAGRGTDIRLGGSGGGKGRAGEAGEGRDSEGEGGSGEAAGGGGGGGGGEGAAGAGGRGRG